MCPAGMLVGSRRPGSAREPPEGLTEPGAYGCSLPAQLKSDGDRQPLHELPLRPTLLGSEVEHYCHRAQSELVDEIGWHAGGQLRCPRDGCLNACTVGKIDRSRCTDRKPGPESRGNVGEYVWVVELRDDHHGLARRHIFTDFDENGQHPAVARGMSRQRASTAVEHCPFRV